MLTAACGYRSPLARRLVAAVRGHRAPVRRHQDPPLAPPQQQLPQAVEGRSSDREHVGRLRRAVNQVPGPAAPRQAPLLGEGLWRFWGDARGRETKSGGAKGTHAPGVVQKRDSEAEVPSSAQRGADQHWGDPAHAKLGAASGAGNAPGGPASVAAPMMVASRRAGWAEGGVWPTPPRVSDKGRLPLFIRVQPPDEGCRLAAQLCARSCSFPCFLLPAPAPHWQRTRRFCAAAAPLPCPPHSISLPLPLAAHAARGGGARGARRAGRPSRSLREARHTRRGTCMGGVAAHSRTSGPPLAACRSSHDSPPPGSAGLVGVEAGQGWAGQRAGRGCLLAA